MRRHEPAARLAFAIGILAPFAPGRVNFSVENRSILPAQEPQETFAGVKSGFAVVVAVSGLGAGWIFLKEKSLRVNGFRTE
jgi:hypothetical protein